MYTEMKNAHALKIHEGMMEISKGNQQSIDAATLLISAANTSMQYQTDPICMYKWLTKKKKLLTLNDPFDNIIFQLNRV